MPRKKFVRHFPDARFGVSREMVDVEAGYVAREHQDYLTLATSHMEEKLHDLRRKWSEADQTVEALVRCLPRREALAFQCMLVRDLFLLMELYASCLRTAHDALDPKPVIPAPAPRPAPATDKALPFSEWLFEPSN
jgi:hypothetical protein